jgi:motility quorum-sensing regulator / GCU-specific mRNA interferase toxin
MEKRKPHYPLELVQSLVRGGAYCVTRAARDAAVSDFGIVELRDIADFVLAMTAADFYKSMTSYGDARLWQDVYHPNIAGLAAYVKVQIVDANTVVISFKRL